MSAPVVTRSPLNAKEAARVNGNLVERFVPRPIVRRDHILPLLIAASLIVHATIILPSLLRRDPSVRTPSNEIAVEIVRLPPPKEKPKAAAAKPPPQKPQEAQKKPPKPAAKPGTERFKDLIGPMPAIALPAASAEGTEATSYAQLVLSQVAKAKKQGRFAGVEGAASVAFTLGDQGEVASVSIVRPSGDHSLDEEAIAMIKRGAPYPKPPPGGRRDYTVTLRFQPLI